MLNNHFTVDDLNVGTFFKHRKQRCRMLNNHFTVDDLNVKHRQTQRAARARTSLAPRGGRWAARRATRPRC
jgi:hypothetical protein